MGTLIGSLWILFACMCAVTFYMVCYAIALCAIILGILLLCDLIFKTHFGRKTVRKILDLI